MRKLLLSLIFVLLFVTNAYATVHEIQFFCDSCETTVKRLWEDGSTITCPVNATHSIHSDYSIIRSINPTYNFDSKGRLKTVNASGCTDKIWSYFTSHGDDAVNGVGESTDHLAFYITSEAEVVKTIEFIEDVEIHYGIASYKGAEIEDIVSLYAYAPATQVETWETGLKFMKYEIIPYSGLNILLPASESWNGDTYQVKLNTYPVPVESYDADWNYTGQWDREMNPSPPEGYAISGYTYNAEGTGKFAFYDFPITLGYFAKNIHLVADHNGTATFMNEDSFRCYKGWQVKVKVKNGNTARTTPLELAVILKINRKTIR